MKKKEGRGDLGATLPEGHTIRVRYDEGDWRKGEDRLSLLLPPASRGIIGPDTNCILHCKMCDLSCTCEISLETLDLIFARLTSRAYNCWD